MDTSISSDTNSFIDRIFEVGVVQFGSFTLKSGVVSPVYVDFRLLISYPSILVEACRLLCIELENSMPITCFDVICGVPNAAIPIATHLSIKNNIPMIMHRKQLKEHGSGKNIEGIFSPGMKCLVVEDVITSGSSILETVNYLRNAGLIIEHASVMLDRQQGGEENIKCQGLTLHSLLTFKLLLSRLEATGNIPKNIPLEVNNFLLESQICINSSLKSVILKKNNDPKSSSTVDKCYFERNLNTRMQEVAHPLAKRLLNIIQSKQTNLALAADLANSTEVLAIARELGPYICLLKLHSDALDDIQDYNKFIKELKSIANSENFLLCEDRKLSDIGSTMARQYQQLTWADIVTFHTITGPASFEAIRNIIKNMKLNESHGCLLVVEMSNEGNLITSDYTKKSVKMALEYNDIVIGVICQNRPENTSSFLSLTPGVRIDMGADYLDQRYSDPTHVMKERGADIVIVGRGILQAENRVDAAKLYRQKVFEVFD